MGSETNSLGLVFVEEENHQAWIAQFITCCNHAHSVNGTNYAMKTIKKLPFQSTQLQYEINLLQFMDMISLEGKTNFFEKRVGEYAKSGVGVSKDEQIFDLTTDF